MQLNIGAVDSIVIVVYLVGIVALGCWVGLRAPQGHGADAKDYFLAGGTLTWPVIGLALFSTNISTIHLVSFAQEGYVNGLAYGNFEWMAAFTLIILSLFFAPFYIRSRRGHAARLPGEALQPALPRLAGGPLDRLGDLHPHRLLALHRRGRAGGHVRHRPLRRASSLDSPR